MASPTRAAQSQMMSEVVTPHASAANPAVADPAVFGPYGVGVTTIELYDASRDRTIPTEIWYPAHTDVGAPGEKYLNVLWGQATRDAEPDLSGGNYPLLVFSHGSGGTRLQSIYYTEHMASHGYVVVAPDHQGNTMFDYDDAATAKAAVDRPLDITFLIDHMLEFNETGEVLPAGMIDPDRIGMSGHSYGGYTTHMICGAQVDINAAKQVCADGDQMICDAVIYVEQLYGTGLEWLDLSDDRVSACTPMAPGLYELFGEEGMSHVFAPLADLAAGNDSTLPYDTDGVPMYQATPAPKYLLTTLHRDHLVYSSLADIYLFRIPMCDSYAECSNRDPSHEPNNIFTTAFFGYYLSGLTEYESYLQADFYSSNYRLTMKLESQLE